MIGAEVIIFSAMIMAFMAIINCRGCEPTEADFTYDELFAGDDVENERNVNYQNSLSSPPKYALYDPLTA